MTLIEKVARAIAKQNGDADDFSICHMELARAAITAMRHPGHFITFHGNMHFGCHPDDPMAETAWQAMIDAALAEPVNAEIMETKR